MLEWIWKAILVPYNVFFFAYHWFVATYHIMVYLSGQWGSIKYK